MKILVVAHYQNDGSPTAIFVHDQIKEYLRAGHDVLVIVPLAIGKADMQGKRLAVGINEQVIDGIRHVFLRYSTLSRYGERHFNHTSAIIALKVRLGAVLKGFYPDIIHAHTLGFDSRIGAWLKERLGCPLVVTTHGSDTNIPLENGQQALLKQSCDQADAVVAVSNQLKERLASCGTRTKLYAIHNGFVLRPISEEIERKAHSIIQVGHLVPSKRVDITIRAFAQLRKKYTDMTLTIVGQGPMREELEKLCLQLNVADAVQFTGQISNEQVFARMCESGFFVMVSKPEGFGIVYLEAMAAGCVVIGTCGEGIADLIDNGENGFLVPADDPQAIAQAITSCVQNLESAKVIAERGRQTAAGLTWKNNVEQYINLFKELLQC